MPAYTKVICNDCGEEDLLPYGEDELEYGWHVYQDGEECRCDSCANRTPANPVEEMEMAATAQMMAEEAMADLGEIAA